MRAQLRDYVCVHANAIVTRTKIGSKADGRLHAGVPSRISIAALGSLAQILAPLSRHCLQRWRQLIGLKYLYK